MKGDVAETEQQHLGHLPDASYLIRQKASNSFEHRTKLDDRYFGESVPRYSACQLRFICLFCHIDLLAADAAQALSCRVVP